MNYPGIRIEGAILSPDILERLEELPGQKPTDFGLDADSKVKDEIARAWADAQDYWRIFRRKLETLKPDSPAVTETRQQWVIPLLGLLGYRLEYQSRAFELHGKTAHISHRTNNGAQTPVQIVGYREPAGLDRKPERGPARMSAHAALQEFLNLNEQLYGLATNGRLLRLLRDSSRLIKLSYLEFDLDRIFGDALFSDFAILFRLLHATRLPASNEAAPASLIERYHQDSLDSGARIRDGLSQAVEQAIRDFGSGFLAHADNQALREAVADGRLSAEDYYRCLLRLIYRLLFLMVIEERDLLFPPQADPRHRDTYSRYYSVQRLRRLSEKRYLADRRRHDLWPALLACFRLLEADGPGEKLGLAPLAGDLFGRQGIGALVDCTLGNDVLLGCLRALNVYRHPEKQQLLRVNYAALNVEEFGSVYEGLLEYRPVFRTTEGEWKTQGTPASNTTNDEWNALGPPASRRPIEFDFMAGEERAATGSHHTPDDLVQPLIQHALDPLIAERRAPGRRAQSRTHGRSGAPRLANRRHCLRLGTHPAGRRPAHRRRTGRRTHRRGAALPQRLSRRPARSDPYLYLWRGPQPAGRGAVQGSPLAGGPQSGYAAQFSGPPHQVRQRHRGLCRPGGGGPRRSRRGLRRHVGRRQGAGRPTAQGQQAGSRRSGQRSTAPGTGPADATGPPTEPVEHALLSAGTHSRGDRGQEGPLPGLCRRAGKLLAAADRRHPHRPVLHPQDAGEPQLPDRRLRFSPLLERRPHAAGAGHRPGLGHGSAQALFHWFLEFPEIVARGGFDCILGNPPYLGGTHLSGTYGYPFCHYVKWEYAPTGLSDLVTYFVRRIYSLLHQGGFTAFITTNSIKDGDIRKDGLEQVLAQGGEINMAVRGIRWPGRANLVVSLVSIHRGQSAD